DALQGFQTVAVSAQIPTDMPPVDLEQRFDPKDYAGSGVDGSRASDIVVSGNEVYAEALVEERPTLLSAPAPVYPALLKQAGIQGRVILPAVIQTTGRVEPASVSSMKPSHPARGVHPVDSGVASVGRAERLLNLPHHLRLMLAALPCGLRQQHEHCAAPPRTGESGTERARPARRSDDRVQLRRAAVVQPSTGFVGLVEQLTKALQLSAGEQLRTEPRAGGLAHD